MDKIPGKINKIMKDYISKLEKNNVHIKQAVLFGSFSKGLADQWSDIDIVSPKNEILMKKRR